VGWFRTYRETDEGSGIGTDRPALRFPSGPKAGHSIRRYTCARGTIAREDPSRWVLLGLLLFRSFLAQTVVLVLPTEYKIRNELRASEILQRVCGKRKSQSSFRPNFALRTRAAALSHNDLTHGSFRVLSYGRQEANYGMFSQRGDADVKN
jgi:hypothetical protein